jgi:F5/8 type C domain
VQPSRRTFLQLNSAVLAEGTATGPEATNLALNRPVTASSTDYAPTPPPFAVDGVAAAGTPDGTGWRAAAGDPQWIMVDLETVCQVDGIGLVFEAPRDAPPFVPPANQINGSPRGSTLGNEIPSSCAAAYSEAVSADGQSWQNVYSPSNGTGTVEIPLPRPVPARWVRMTVTQRRIRTRWDSMSSGYWAPARGTARR